MKRRVAFPVCVGIEIILDHTTMKQKLTVVASVLLLTFGIASNGISQWIPAAGVPGGMIGSVAMNGTTILAQTFPGFFLSADAGMSWSQVAGLSDKSVRMVRANGTNFFAETDSGLFISTDNGVTWLADTVGLPPGGTNDFTVGGSKLYTLLAGWDIYSSTDNGLSWSFLDSGQYLSGIAASDTKLFAVGWNIDRGLWTILFSSDWGKSWNEQDSAWTYSDPASSSAPILFVMGNNLFASTLTNGILRSTDNGATWAPVNTGLPIPDVGTLAISGTNLFAGTFHGVFLSTNNGDSWAAVNSGLGDTNIRAIAINGGTVAAATNGGVFISSNNGTDWNGINIGLANPSVLAFGSNYTTLVAGTERGGLLHSTDNGSSWAVSSAGIGSSTSLTSFASIGSTLFGTTGWAGQVIRSTDAGASWKAVFTYEIYHVSSLAVIDTNLFVGTDLGVYLSTDSGTSWKPTSSPPEQVFGDVVSMAVEGTNLFAGTSDNGIFFSTDLGASWTAVNSGLTNMTVHSLSVDGTNIFAGTNGGVFLSTNDGSNWIAMNSGITDTAVTSFAWSGNNLFAGTEHAGIFISSNNGTSWSAVNDGLGNAYVNALTISGPNLIAGTNGIGVWHRPLAEMIASSGISSSKTPTTFTLEQNYPNPFQASTQINFNLAEPAMVTLEVFDMLGRKVQTLENAMMEVGRHTTQFDGTNLAGGIYPAILTSNNVQYQLKMVLNK